METSPDDAALRLIGDMDLSNVDLLREAVRASTPLEGGLILDLSELTFMDSTGLQLIVDIATKIEDGELVLRGPSPMVRKILRVSGVDRLATIVIKTGEEGDEDFPAEDAG